MAGNQYWAEKKEAKVKFREWYFLTEDERRERGLPLVISNWYKPNGVSETTVYKWKEQIVKELKTPSKTTGGVKFEESISFLKAQEMKVAEVLANKLLSGQANAKEVELYYKLIGKLDKPEVKGKVDVSINVKNLIGIANQELEQSGYRGVGVVEMQNESALLSRKPLQDTGQGDNDHITVQDVGVSEESTDEDS